LSITVNTGADGAPGSDKLATGELDAHPLSNVTVYDPEPSPEITYGSVTPVALPDAAPIQDTFPVPVPITVTEPLVVPHVEGFEDVNEITGDDNGFAFPVPGVEVHPATVCVTV
jgi:hypothetical protein